MALVHQSDDSLYHLSLAKNSVPSDIWVLSFDGVFGFGLVWF